MQAARSKIKRRTMEPGRRVQPDGHAFWARAKAGFEEATQEGIMNRREFIAGTAGLVAAGASLQAVTQTAAAASVVAPRGPGLATDGKAASFGDFRHQVLLGPYEPSIEAMTPGFAPHGLALDAGMIYGRFQDSEGNILSALRKVGTYWTSTLNINSNLDGGQLMTHAAPQSSYSGEILCDVEDDRITWRSFPTPGRDTRPFSYTQDLQTCSWDEGDLLSIEGQIMRPGMQWLNVRPGDGCLYGLQCVKAEGVMLGRKVKGWYGYDFIYTPIGKPWTYGPYFNQLEVAYHTFANEYDDGSVEYGMLCYGLEDWTFAIASVGDGLTLCTRDLDVQIVQKENGFPKEILYDAGDVQYLWNADPRGELHGRTDWGQGIYRGAEGWCQRIGDKRKVVNNLGWIDYFNDGRAKSKLVDKIDFSRAGARG
jgi:hypothetical protein